MKSIKSIVGGRLTLFLLSAAILLLAFWLRLANLYALPAFIDEGVHVLWAQRWAVGNTEYPWLMDGRIATVFLFSLVQMEGPDPLWVARAFVAIVSTLACGACISLGMQLNSRSAGLLVGLIYALLPLAVFHERQAMADPISAAFGACAMALSLRLAQSKHRWLFLGLGLSLAITFLTKVQGIVVVIYLVLNALVVIQQPFQKRLRTWLGYAGALLSAGIVVLIFFVIFKDRLGRTDITSIQAGSIVSNLANSLSNMGAQVGVLTGSATQLADVIASQVGWMMIGLAVLAIVVSLPAHRLQVVTLLIFGLITLIAILIAEWIGLLPCCGNLAPARYIMLVGVPISILAALALVNLVRLLSVRLTPLIVSGLPLVLLALALLPMLRNDAAILTTPEKASYSKLDFWGYFSGYFPSRQLLQAIDETKAREVETNLPPVIIVSGGPVYIVSAYFDRQQVDVRASGEVSPVEFGEWFARRQHVYLIDETTADTPAEPCQTDYGTLCVDLARYPVPYGDEGRTVRLRLATAADSHLRPQIYANLFPRPEKLTADYESVVGGLPANVPTTLLVYPPNQADALESLLTNKSNITVVPIGDSWPLDVDAAEAQLQAVTVSQSNIQVVLVEETKGDPDRQLETWLKSHLFVLGEQWLGPVRLLNFAGDGPVEQTIPVNGRFGENITLNSVEVLDSTSQSGGLVRLRLNWQTASPISIQYKVFAHIFAGDRIIAQHDGQPVGELRPTNTWQVGAVIRDQFAIQLPADAPPGDYQLRIGLYDLETQARLPVLFPDGTSGEFFVGGTITLQ